MTYENVVPPVICIFCKKELFSLPLPGAKRTDYEMVDGGVIGFLYAPFGSKHDGTIFQIGICDECIEKENIKEVGDYLFSDMDKMIKERNSNENKN